MRIEYAFLENLPTVLPKVCTFESSVSDKKLFNSDPDPNCLFIMDADPIFEVMSDPDSFWIYRKYGSFSTTEISGTFHKKKIVTSPQVFVSFCEISHSRLKFIIL